MKRKRRNNPCKCKFVYILYNEHKSNDVKHQFLAQKPEKSSDTASSANEPSPKKHASKTTRKRRNYPKKCKFVYNLYM